MPAKYSDNGNWIGNAKGEEWFNEMLDFLERNDCMTPIFEAKLTTAKNSSEVGDTFKKSGNLIIIPPFKRQLSGDWSGKGGWLTMWSENKQAFQLIQPKNDWLMRSAGTIYRYKQNRWVFQSGEVFSDNIVLITTVNGAELPSAYYSTKGAVFIVQDKIFICYNTSAGNKWYQIATVP